MFAYKTAVQESTKFIPFFMNMGINPIPPSTLGRAAEKGQEASTLERWQHRLESLESARQKAATNAVKAQERQARYYSAKRRQVEYAVGEEVT